MIMLTDGRSWAAKAFRSQLRERATRPFTASIAFVFSVSSEHREGNLLFMKSRHPPSFTALYRAWQHSERFLRSLAEGRSAKIWYRISSGKFESIFSKDQIY